MTDSVRVFPPGFRVLDGNGAPVNNAKIKFKSPGAAGDLDVFSDSILSTDLGPTVRTRSDGCPVASYGSNTTVQIYTGTAAYWVQITDANDVEIFPAQDNVKGAVDTSLFLTASALTTFTMPVVSATGDTSLGATHKGKLINANPGGGSFSLTLTSAVTLGDNWVAAIRHAGTANNVRIAAPQAIAHPMGSVSAFALRPGEGVIIACDGAAFKVVGYMPPYITADTGVITCADLLSAPPSSPAAGARYLLGAAPSGAWSTYAQHDLVEYDGISAWFKVTPPTNCGWIAYVQSTNLSYQFRNSAWVSGLNVQAADLPAGTIVNRAFASYTANAGLTIVIPIDDTIPQNTEGTSILSVSITPKSLTNRIRVRFSGQAAGDGVSSTGGSAFQVAIAALFQDSIANALCAGFVTANSMGGSANDVRNSLHGTLVLAFEHVPATLSAVTYAIRVGGDAGTIRMNGSIAARRFGGVSMATLIVEEIAA